MYSEIEGSHTNAEWLELREEWERRCACCGRGDVPLTKDHIFPRVYGGSDDIDNIQPLCLSCNSAKGKRNIRYFKGGRAREGRIGRLPIHRSA